MADIIETHPFIRWDIKDIIQHAATKDGAVEKPEAVTEQVIEKVTAFINENYNPKP